MCGSRIPENKSAACGWRESAPLPGHVSLLLRRCLRAYRRVGGESERRPNSWWPIRQLASSRRATGEARASPAFDPAARVFREPPLAYEGLSGASLFAEGGLDAAEAARRCSYVRTSSSQQPDVADAPAVTGPLLLLLSFPVRCGRRGPTLSSLPPPGR
ncbi:hypothetical protein MRX96_016324 [Rhipicephalus microplus]